MTGGSTPLVLLLGVATGGATVCGGALALRFRSALGLLLCFSGGAVLGVALLDLLPEALSLAPPGRPPLAITTAVMVGFLLYLAIDRIPSSPATTDAQGHPHLGPAILTAHSFMDGLGIGLAFHVSSAAGLVVAFAVLAHDLLDGANTVALSLSGGTGSATARRWLAADAAAPLAGLLLAHFASIPTPILTLLLATFAGGFVYIGTVKMLARGGAAEPLRAVALAAAGAAFIYGVVRLMPS